MCRRRWWCLAGCQGQRSRVPAFASSSTVPAAATTGCADVVAVVKTIGEGVDAMHVGIGGGAEAEGVDEVDDVHEGLFFLEQSVRETALVRVV